MKILVTGFDPFGEESINPAFEAVKKLPSTIANATILKLEVPTIFNKSIDKVLASIEKEKPEIVICIGQAGGRFGITPERVAINLDDARIADNDGNQPLGKKIADYGENAYFSTLPIKSIAHTLQKAGIPSSVSNTAGTFVCNHLMYGVLHHIKQQKLSTRAGFIHIPFLLEQVVNKADKPGFSLETLTRGIELAIETCIKTQDDEIAIASGSLH